MSVFTYLKLWLDMCMPSLLCRLVFVSFRIFLGLVLPKAIAFVAPQSYKLYHSCYRIYLKERTKLSIDATSALRMLDKHRHYRKPTLRRVPI